MSSSRLVPPVSTVHACYDIAPIDGDGQGDGTVGIDDLLLLLAAFGGSTAALFPYDGIEHGDSVVGVFDLLRLLPDFGRDISNGCNNAAVGETIDYLDAVVTVKATSAPDHTTYVLSASLHETAASVYSIEGTAHGGMDIPAAYQVATPFGANIGGTPPQSIHLPRLPYTTAGTIAISSLSVHHLTLPQSSNSVQSHSLGRTSLAVCALLARAATRTTSDTGGTSIETTPQVHIQFSKVSSKSSTK